MVLNLKRIAVVLCVLVINLALGGAKPAAATGACWLDYNSDGQIDVRDLQILASHWHSRDPSVIGPYDLDDSAAVNVVDLIQGTWYFGVACADLPYRTQNLFGIAGNNLNETHYEGSEFQAININWVRWQIDWSWVEPVRTDPPTYVWARTDTGDPDKSLKKLVAAGLRPIVILSTNPSWAASTKCGPHDRLPDNTAYLQFVKAVIERYDGDGDYDGDGRVDGPAMPNIREWEFYNEPDWNDMGWDLVGGCWGQHAAAYARLLKDVYPIVHTLNPSARVVLGGIAAEDIGINSNIQQPYFNFSRLPSAQSNDFMTQILAAGAGPYMDAVNFHHYSAFDRYWTQAGWGLGIQGKVNWINERLTAAGVPLKPVIVSETGLRSDPTPIDGVPGTPDLQARFVVKVHARAIASGVRSLIWFTYQDAPGEAWGLIDRDYNTKPAYDSFTRMVNFMQGTGFYGRGNFANVEGYRFRTSEGRSLIVAWVIDASIRTGLPLTARLIQVTRYDGQVTNIRDGDAADLDTRPGQMRIVVDDAPIFVETLEP
jgi:hypothetical protein